MDNTTSSTETCELPPLRSLNDFLLESSRFQLPNYRDLEKWGNRVVNNLIYYQTNYLYTFIAIMLLITSVNPRKVLMGLAVVALMGVASTYMISRSSKLNGFRKKQPLICTLFFVYAMIQVVYSRHSVIFLLLGIFLSFSVIFIHASLRLRNMKNKLVNKIEGLGLERTPMGAVLKYIGMREEFFR